MSYHGLRDPTIIWDQCHMTSSEHSHSITGSKSLHTVKTVVCMAHQLVFTPMV